MKRTNAKQGRRAGFVATSELLFLTTILVIGLVAGWVTVRNTMNTELEDTAEAVGDLNQSYAYAGVFNDNQTASTSGSRFVDATDDNAADSADGANDGLTVYPPFVPQVGYELRMSP